MSMTTQPLRRAIGWYRLPVVLIALAASSLLYVPFIVVIATSWTEGAFILFPPEGFSFKWYQDVLGDDLWMDAFRLSLIVSALATVVAVVLGTLGALALTRLRSRAAQRWLRTLFIVPMAVPPVAYAAGLYVMKINVVALQDNLLLLVLGEALLAVPFVFVLVSTGVSRSDPALRPAASTLGASWPMILWRVELPALVPQIVAGALFAFVVVFDEVVLSVFLTPAGVKTLPLKMLSASQEALSPQLTAASTMVSLLALLVLGIFTLISSRRASRAERVARKEALA
jgi:putative spermidine/putrescine transport system permease protein